MILFNASHCQVGESSADEERNATKPSTEETSALPEGVDSFPMATFNGVPILPMVINEHSSLVIVAWELIGWIIGFSLQVAWTALAIVGYFPFVACWFIIGMLMQHMKMTIIGRAWNFWFYVWVGENTFEVCLMYHFGHSYYISFFHHLLDNIILGAKYSC